VEKIKDVLQFGKEWFHGNESLEVSDSLLAAAREKELSANPSSSGSGLFLIRYSRVPGVFTMSYTKKDKFCHTRLLKNDLSGGVETITGGNYKYSKMSVFVTKNAAIGNLFSTPISNPASYLEKLRAKQRIHMEKTKQLVDLLSGMGLSKYVAVMKREEINIDSFKLLEIDDLINMKIPTGPRKMMMAHIFRLNNCDEDVEMDMQQAWKGLRQMRRGSAAPYLQTGRMGYEEDNTWNHDGEEEEDQGEGEEDDDGNEGDNDEKEKGVDLNFFASKSGKPNNSKAPAVKVLQKNQSVLKRGMSETVLQKKRRGKLGLDKEGEKLERRKKMNQLEDLMNRIQCKILQLL